MSAIVYRVFDADGALLYIGSTKRDLGARLPEHAGKPWACRAKRVDVARFDSIEEARDAERDAIAAERPLHNIQHQHQSPNPLEPYLHMTFDEFEQAVYRVQRRALVYRSKAALLLEYYDELSPTADCTASLHEVIRARAKAKADQGAQS